MHTRYSTALGFLAAASLLSGSAFAFAPEFVGDLPTVVITDKISGATLPNIFDPANATTQYLFRYEDAFDLSDPSYIDPGPSATIGQVKYLFNEFLDDDHNGTPDSAVPEAFSGRTLSINDSTLYATPGFEFPLGSAEFASAPVVGLLDFRNIDFSPGLYANVSGIPFDEIGNNTGYNLLLSGAQYRTVQLYINTDFATEAPSIKNFTVITTLDGEDRLTGSSTVFTPVVGPTNDFDPWSTGGAGQLGAFPASGTTFTNSGPGPTTFTGYTVSPAVALPGGDAPGGTTQLGITASTAAIGFVNWNYTPTVGLLANANDLIRYRIRLVSSSNAANQKDQVRAATGFLKTGQANHLYANADAARFLSSIDSTPPPEALLANIPTTPLDYDTFLIAEANGDLPFSIEFLNVDTGGTSGNDITASEYSIAKTTRAQLAGKNVLKNRGGAVPTPIVGETLAVESTGLSGFTFGAVDGTDLAGVTAGTASNSTVVAAITMAGTTSTVTHNLNAAAVPGGAFHPVFNQIGFASSAIDIEATTGGAFTMQNGKLYIVDVWASTTTPSSGHIPILRIDTNAGNMQLDATIHTISPNLFGGLNAGAEIQSAPRAYSHAHYAQLGGNSSMWAQLNILFLYQINGLNMNTNANVTIHRIVLTEYDAPQ